jgi:uncharacterized protein (DUF983 family)
MTHQIHAEAAERSQIQAMLRGFLLRCPNCGEGRMFGRFLKVRDRCEACGQELFHHRADDAPPYVVMFIVGHVVIAAMLWVEVMYSPAMWVHAALWLPLTLVLSFALLQPVKGALVGLQWANRMHGFDPDGDAAAHGHQ